MSEQEEMITVSEAEAAVNALSRRLGMLHLAYAKTLVAELGREKALELIKKSVWAYGTQVGSETRARVEAQGLQNTPDNFKKGSDLSPIGFKPIKVEIDGEISARQFHCHIADVWKEAGEMELGGLYCLVDPAKMQAYNPEYTMVHLQKIPDGGECCDNVIRKIEKA